MVWRRLDTSSVSVLMTVTRVPRSSEVLDVFSSVIGMIFCSVPAFDYSINGALKLSPAKRAANGILILGQLASRTLGHFHQSTSWKAGISS